MRWKTKPKPEYGDFRTRKVFALLPTRMDDNVIVWLEQYNQREQWTEEYGRYPDYWELISRTSIEKKKD